RRSGWPHQIKTFKTEQEAIDWGDQIEDAMRNGTFSEYEGPPPPKTVNEMLTRYFEEVSVNKAENGRSDRNRIERLKGHLGRYSVHYLNSRRVTQYKNDRLAEGAGPQT